MYHLDTISKYEIKIIIKKGEKQYIKNSHNSIIDN